jgi:hypothetical protein
VPITSKDESIFFSERTGMELLTCYDWTRNMFNINSKTALPKFHKIQEIILYCIQNYKYWEN